MIDRLAPRASSATVAYISELELVMKSVSPSNLCSATLRADHVFRLRVYSTSGDAPADDLITADDLIRGSGGGEPEPNRESP